MVECCERAGVPLMVNHNSCFAPGFVAIEPYLRGGQLGRIYHCSIHNYNFFTTFPERHIIPAMVIHHLALVHHWFGPVESVFCQADGHDRSLAEGEVMAVVQLRHASGVATLLVNDWSFLSHSHVGPAHSREEVRVQGSQGSIFGHSEDMTVYLSEPAPVEIKPVIRGPWFPDAFGLAMAHFQDCLATGAKPLTDGRGNLHVLQTAFACYESARSGRVVRPAEIALDGDWDLSPQPVLGPDGRPF
jgi:UDP-2-acetamido-3-amino-2,3-dideoxy-glucuronate N-acetyltransferase